MRISFLLILGQIIAAPLLRLMNTIDDVIDLAATYLRIYFMGMPFVMLYNFVRQFWEVSATQAIALLSCNFRYCKCSFEPLLCNRLRYERCGVGIATVIADGISTDPYGCSSSETRTINRISSKNFHSRKNISLWFWKSSSAGIQGMVFSISNVFIQT